MICSKCGQANADNVSFCAACGQKLTPPAAQVPGARPTAMPLNPPMPDAAQPTIPVNIPPPTMYGTPPQSPSGYSPPPGPQSLTGEPVPPVGGPAYSASPTVAYSGVCRVCGNPLTPRDYSCPRCSTPVGMVANPNDPTSASYVQVGSVGYLENTSGQKSTVPPEIANYKWNWGAFLLSGLWLCFHGFVALGIGLILLNFVGRFIPVVGSLIGLAVFGVAIYLGIAGHKLAWKNRRYESIEHYKAVETKWMQWGCAVAIIIFVLSILLGVVLVAMMSASHPSGG